VLVVVLVVVVGRCRIQERTQLPRTTTIVVQLPVLNPPPQLLSCLLPGAVRANSGEER
jgi:hypothetical protein